MVDEKILTSAHLSYASTVSTYRIGVWFWLCGWGGDVAIVFSSAETWLTEYLSHPRQVSKNHLYSIVPFRPFLPFFLSAYLPNLPRYLVWSYRTRRRNTSLSCCMQVRCTIYASGMAKQAYLPRW